MLTSQPLGFYSASQLVQDAKCHGVEVRRADVMHSDWDCTLEGLPHPPAVRLGLRLVSGLKLESGQRIVAARSGAPFDSAEDLARRPGSNSTR
jgi:error-prone DNA polymerase